MSLTSFTLPIFHGVHVRTSILEMCPHPSDYTLKKAKSVQTKMYIDEYQIYGYSFFELFFFFFITKNHYHTTNSSFHIEKDVGARESVLKEYSSTMCDYHQQEFQHVSLNVFT